jgi:TolB protein
MQRAFCVDLGRATAAALAVVVGLVGTADAASNTTNGKIVFQRNSNVQADLFAVTPTGEEERVLAANALHPAWSPNGRQIAFAASRDGNAGIYVMNADGSEQTRLTDDPSGDFFPDWSPDGRKIAFTSNRDGNSEIYVMNADGSEQTRLTDDPAVDQFADWSPDGKQIVFGRVGFPSGVQEIYVMDADGGNQRRLADGRFPAWSPNGQQIAFNPRASEIYVMEADGREPRLVTDGVGSLNLFPAWSPDGKQLAFVSNRDGNLNVYIINLDGTGLTRVTSDPRPDVLPDWHPAHFAPSAVAGSEP